VSGGVCFFFFFLNKEARAPFIVKSHEALQRQNEGYKTPLHPKSETNLTKQLSKQYTNITWTPLKLHSTNKSSKYLCITKTLWNTQTTREYTNKHKQEALTLPSTLEESTPPLEAAREQHSPLQESPQQRNNLLQPPITANHDLTRWWDPHAPMRSTRTNLRREMGACVVLYGSSAILIIYI